MKRPALTRRVALTLLSVLACITAAFAPGGGPSDIGDEPPTQPQGQDFVCDLNDGRIDVEVLPDGTVRYERDTMYGAFNVYRGEVDVMVSAGIYTQDLLAVAGASRWCDATSGSLMDGYTPPLGHIAFYVATGTRPDGESFPGENSAHTDRPHHHACHPCNNNSNCGSGTFCSKAPGNCGGKGVCARTPTACPDVWLPVCGCDGMTYGNQCDAAAAGVSVAHHGECEGCTSNADCDSNEFCLKASCESTDVGHCAGRPQGCITLWMPVCGCDGMTYGNGCEAAAAGVNVKHPGECPGCTTNADCPSTDYCFRPDGACGDTGFCLMRSEYCPTHIDPVCGCDGKTYQNSCLAGVGGSSIAHDGACTCDSNAECVASQFCLTSDCGSAGTCGTRPTICPDVWLPVCGCDGNTYGNACEAHAAGVSVQHSGECGP